MQAFVVSFVITTLMIFAPLRYGDRRPVGTPLSWGAAMGASTYVFFVMFLAYGVVPHQWLTWVQNELGWRADKLVYGLGDVFKSQARGGWFPFDINWLQIGDIIVLGIYVFFVALQIVTWTKWQKRGTKVSTEIETSTYGRPLVKKA